MHFAETFEFLDRTRGSGVDVVDVQLDNLVAGTGARVGNGHGGGHGAVHGHFRSTQGDRGVGVGGVTEAVSERIQRRVDFVDITAHELLVVGIVGMRATGVLVIIVEGELPHAAREGGREFGRWIHVAEEDIGNGVTAFGTGAPLAFEQIGEKTNENGGYAPCRCRTFASQNIAI